jgi:hypothetical protein
MFNIPIWDSPSFSLISKSLSLILNFFLISGTDKDRYERALGEASRILSNSQLNLLKLSLAMHSDSPRVEMYNQIALQRGVKCPVALDVGDALLCTLDSLENTINSYLVRIFIIYMFFISLDYLSVLGRNLRSRGIHFTTNMKAV